MFASGEYLRSQGQYRDAVARFEAAVQHCKKKESNKALAIIDTLVRDHRIWLQQNGKYAIATVRGEPITPYQFSKPEPFRNGVAIYSGYIGEPKVEKYFLVDKTGKTLTPAGYDAIIPVEGGGYYLKNSDLHSFIAGSDKTPERWTSNSQPYPLPLSELDSNGLLRQFSATQKNGKEAAKVPGLLQTNKNGMFVDESGKPFVIPMSIYGDVYEFNDGMAQVSKKGKWGYMNAEGKVVVPMIYDVTQAFSNGFGRINQGQKWGLVNARGEVIVAPVYEKLDDFSEGRAVMRKDGKMGYIDTTGSEVIPAIYSYASFFSEGLAVVRRGGKYIVIDKAGTELIQTEYQEISFFKNGMARVWKGEKMGFIDKNFVEIVEPVYDQITGFIEGRAFAKKDNQWVILDNKGKVLRKLQKSYTRIFPFQDGLTANFKGNLMQFRINNLSGLINTNGEEVVKPYYDYIESIAICNRIVVTKNGKQGLIDPAGKEVLAPTYSHIDYFHEGLAYVSVSEDLQRVACIDTNGIQVFEVPQKCFGQDFKEGFAWMSRFLEVSTYYGAIDATGKFIVPPVAHSYVRCGKGQYLLLIEGKKGLFYVDEKTHIPPIYDEIAHPHAAWVMVKTKGKWGWTDHRGHEIIPCRYDAITPFNEEDRATVMQFGMQFQINRKGEMIFWN
ncbi:MAG: WG repeat-containing protein [Saprospiraceae bacterium]|nr:WG repeat-containing protein [Saprospiraceae bacterium]